MKTRSEIRHGLLLTFGLFWMVFCIIIYVNQSVFKYQSKKPIYNVQESLNVNVRHQFQGTKLLLLLTQFCFYFHIDKVGAFIIQLSLYLIQQIILDRNAQLMSIVSQVTFAPMGSVNWFYHAL